jgi:glycine cleavage system regulatory protein
MAKYTFIKHRDTESQFDTTSVTMEVEAEILPEIIEEFANFLKATGYFEKSVEKALNLNQDE